LYEALTSAGVTVFRHRHWFDADAEDREWLPVVGMNGWIVLTKDEGMQHSEIEKIAIKNASVRAFILVRGNLSGQEMASIFVKALPAMARVIKKHPAPFIAKIYRDASVLKTDLV
jgi:predicted nuclease of predicted toxin-antitoxin system